MRSTLKLPSWVSIRSEKLQGMIMENEVANAAKDKSEWLWDAMIDWLLERWWWWNCAGFKCIYCESVPSIRFPQWVFVCARYNSAMISTMRLLPISYGFDQKKKNFAFMSAANLLGSTLSLMGAPRWFVFGFKFLFLFFWCVEL